MQHIHSLCDIDYSSLPGASNGDELFVFFNQAINAVGPENLPIFLNGYIVVSIMARLQSLFYDNYFLLKACSVCFSHKYKFMKKCLAAYFIF